VLQQQLLPLQVRGAFFCGKMKFSQHNVYAISLGFVTASSCIYAGTISPWRVFIDDDSNNQAG